MLLQTNIATQTLTRTHLNITFLSSITNPCCEIKYLYQEITNFYKIVVNDIGKTYSLDVALLHFSNLEGK